MNLPKIAAKNPFPVEVEQDKKYFWCSCGLSQKQPFCDGAHKAYKNEDGSSLMKSISFTATENKTVFLCGCKHSKNPPFCDGTHSSC
ncbi:MAG: CDGSH iron-sulfur domain-containing protein [Proteobacteria bacterium]|nr:CDGSH iron-sulfur domain-containing protein [Pseudomonadota bacterium]